MHNFNEIISFLAGSTLDNDTLTWTVPIVGITIVMLAITTLAFILKQLIWLNPEAREAKQNEKATVVDAKSEVIEEKSGNNSSSQNVEDEISVAISTALYLHISDAGSSVNLTEVPGNFNISPWTVVGRNAQSSNFNRWQSQKRWSR